MRRTILFFALLFSLHSISQMKVKINGALIQNDAVLKAEDIKSMEVAFENPKKLNYYYGKAFIYIDLTNPDGSLVEEFLMEKKGENAIKAFVEDEANTFFALPSAEKPRSSFTKLVYYYGDTGIEKVLKNAGKDKDSKTITVKIALGYRDEIGYQKYGDLVKMVKEFTFTIDNTLNFEAGQKEKEQAKIQEAKPAQSTKESTGTKILRGILGR